MPEPMISGRNGSARQPAARLHYLDTLRVLAIGMVFLFHAVHPFDFGDWQVKNVAQSELLTIILLFLSMWGMPAFFMLAGAGSWFALQRRTSRQYVSERLYRLFIPFIVGSILFTPVEYYCEYMNKIQRGLLTSFPPFLSAFTVFNPRLLRFPGFSPRWFGVAGYHLWFLGFLFCFALITVPLFTRLRDEPGRRTLSWMARLCERRGGLLLFAVLAGVILCLLRPLFLQEHDWADFAFYLFFFAMGFVLFADARFARTLRRDWPILLAVGSVTVAGLVAAYLAGAPVLVWNETPSVAAFYIIQFLRGIIAVCFSLTMLLAGMRWLDFTNKWLRYAQEAALPFFVLHQPVILVIAFFVVQWRAAILTKLLVIVLSSFLATGALYEWIVRRSRLLRLAFGIKARSAD